jgi:hypothetical protein
MQRAKVSCSFQPYVERICGGSDTFVAHQDEAEEFHIGKGLLALRIWRYLFVAHSTF